MYPTHSPRNWEEPAQYPHSLAISNDPCQARLLALGFSLGTLFKADVNVDGANATDRNADGR